MAGILTDRQIRALCMSDQPLIEPFSARVSGEGVASYGLQPCGYDLRLAPEILIFDWTKAQGRTIDPLVPPDPDFYFQKSADPHFDVPPRGFVAGMSLEYLRFPPNITADGKAKNVYTRTGLQMLISSINPGWKGRLHLHIANPTPIPIRVYGNQGIVYLQFVELGENCETSYGELLEPRFQGQTSFLPAPS